MNMDLQVCYCVECKKAVGVCEYYGFKIICTECAVSLARMYEAVGIEQETIKVINEGCRTQNQYNKERQSEFMRSRVYAAINNFEKELNGLSEVDESIMDQIEHGEVQPTSSE